MRHFQSILFVLCILAGISSCNTISDEWQNFVSSGLSDRTEVHICTLYLDAARPSFDEKESGNTRASGGRWEDGDVVYLRISESVYGQGVYSASTDSWVFEYYGTLNESKGDCSALYFSDKLGEERGIVQLNEHSAVFSDDQASFMYKNGALSLKTTLSPSCWRLRLKGMDNLHAATLKRNDKISFFSSYDEKLGRFSYQNKDIVFSPKDELYSDYIYASPIDQNNILSFISDGGLYNRTFLAEHFSAGSSGILTVPTQYRHSGWDEIIKVAKLVEGKEFNNSIKQLVGEDSWSVDWNIIEINFYCVSDNTTGVLISSDDSEYPIYANYSDGIVSINTEAVKIEPPMNMSSMFSNFTSLECLDLSCMDFTHEYSTSEMFGNCSGLKSITFPMSEDGRSIIRLRNMSGMFRGCGSLVSIDMSYFDTSLVTDMSNLFSECWNLQNLNFIRQDDYDSEQYFVTTNVRNMRSMFGNCTSLAIIDLRHFDTSKVTDMKSMFDHCISLATIDLSHFDTSKVTDMGSMFSGCTSLATIDLRHFDTSNVTDMSWMFSSCNAPLDVSHFDTSNVSDMMGMFDGCSFATIDLSHFDTSNVTDMSYMFHSCTSLATIDLSHFDTSNVTDMSWMFEGCSSLAALDLSHFDTSNVTRMSWMFSGCSSLATLDLSHFDTSNVTDMGYMFYRRSSSSGSCSITCLASTKDALLNSSGFPTDVSFTWNILDN